MENPVNPKIEFLKDVKLKFHVQVGSIEKLLVEVLSLKEGDIIELDKSIEEYVNVQLNNRPFAIGEIVITNEKYGVRIVDLAE
ncbi:MAG: flagellar motor switch protein FliN [Epsilonproteobacteria bacterium]|nr:flagellar motor switch protein FliN [Campylobacterota bacterium]